LFKPLAALAGLLAGCTAAADGGVRQAERGGDSAPAPAASGTGQQAGIATSSPAKRDASRRSEAAPLPAASNLQVSSADQARLMRLWRQRTAVGGAPDFTLGPGDCTNASNWRRCRVRASCRTPWYGGQT